MHYTPRVHGAHNRKGQQRHKILWYLRLSKGIYIFYDRCVFGVVEKIDSRGLNISKNVQENQRRQVLRKQIPTIGRAGREPQ